VEALCSRLSRTFCPFINAWNIESEENFSIDPYKAGPVALLYNLWQAAQFVLNKTFPSISSSEVGPKKAFPHMKSLVTTDFYNAIPMSVTAYMSTVLSFISS